MQTISIVIVSYKVRYFLRQCLQSVFKSSVAATLEVIVVDNASNDGTIEMLNDEFPDVILVSNSENLGFGKANNLGFKRASGDYILILNPDTIIEESTLQICMDYFESHDQTGAIGVRMVDGSARYLPESKRGFPTPLNALFKMSGLSRLFASSSFFNTYYLGHIGEYQLAEIEVLSGAFIFTSKTILDTIGGFDEDYFMYGEDIEMSYQIRKMGKKLIYLPETSIIHFKGESTNKKSYSYLKNFYGAMQIYSDKRNNGRSGIWKAILRLGIFSVAVTAIIRSLAKAFLWPLISFVSLYGVSVFMRQLWATYYFGDSAYYKSSAADISLVVLCAILVFCYYLLGLFDRRFRIKQWVYASVASALFLLAVYALFPVEWRFSRFVLIMLISFAPLCFYLVRKLYNRVHFGTWSFSGIPNKRILIMGSMESGNKVKAIIEHYFKVLPFIKYVNPDSSKLEPSDLPELVKLYEINEIIFCSRDLSNEYIFECTQGIGNHVQFKLASNDNSSILGSRSKNTLGEWYTTDFDFKIGQEFHRRSKRIFDLLFCLLAILMIPVLLFKPRQLSLIFKNWLLVVFGKKTWMSYDYDDRNHAQLPGLKPGVFEFRIKGSSDAHQANLYYARNYSIWLEGEYLLKNMLGIN